jgi:hypothetical protein
MENSKQIASSKLIYTSAICLVLLTSCSQSSKLSVPTLLPESRTAHVAQLLGNSSECTLPCWLGLTPGQTTIDQVHELFHHMGEIELEYESDAGINHDYSIEQIYINYQSEGFSVNSVEIAILVNSQSELYAEILKYTGLSILQTHGFPNEVFIFENNPIEIQSRKTYTLALFYFDKGFVVVDQGVLVNADEVSCLPNHLSQSINITIGAHEKLNTIYDYWNTNYVEAPENVRNLVVYEESSMQDFLSIQAECG